MMYPNRGCGNPGPTRSEEGFTLLEVIVGLVIGTIIMGGVMGLISSSLNFTQRIKEKSEVQPILDAAAAEVLVHPEVALKGTVAVGDSRSAPVVGVELAEERGPDGQPVQNNAGELFRIRLSYKGYPLEFSVIIPKSESQ
jgi:prepilin-type N-terminal cleavage/methylation domain-containing protein